MKQKLIILASFIFLTSFQSCKKDSNTNKLTLSAQEISDLTFLREEEKLAHDVYVYSYQKYNQAIFDNISNSELTHTNSVLSLLNKYGITDPVENNEVGVFSDSSLQLLYNELTAKSDSSITKALEVGATIEDLDIHDINTFLSHTSNNDLLKVYNNLNCGSRNHLRAFVSQLGSYTPSFLSQTEYNEILNASHEQCGK